MNNGSFRTYGYKNEGYPDHYVFEWNLVSQDVVKNTSTISWKVYAAGGSKPARFTIVKEKYVSVNGNRQENSDNTKSYNGTTPFSGTTVIQHNSDGTGSFGASCGGAFYYYGSYNSTGSADFTLPKIARAAQFDLSSFENYDRPVEDSVDVKVIINNSSFYSELSIVPLKEQENILLTRKATNGKNTLTFTRQELEKAYKVIPQNSAIFIIKLKTYTDSGKGTLVGEATGGLSYRALITNANPVFSNFTYKDIDSSTTALTGSNQKIVLGKSDLQVDITVENKAIAQKGAVMSSYNLGNFVLSYKDNATVSKPIPNYQSESITVSAIDTRGNSTSITKNLSVVRYFDIVVKGQNIVREDGVGEKTTISFNGQFFNSSFGSQANTVTATYKYRIGNGNFTNGTTPLQISKSGNSFSCNQVIIGDTGNGFSISNSYEIIVTVSDKLSSKEIRYTLIAGAPAIAVYGNKVAFNGKYDESKPYIPVQYHGRSLKGVSVSATQPVEEQDVWFKKSKNLFKIEDITNSNLSIKNGVITILANWSGSLTVPLNFSLEAGTYTFRGASKEGNPYPYFIFQDEDDKNIIETDYNNKVITFTIPSQRNFRKLVLYNSSSIVGDVIRPMLSSGRDDISWEPYVDKEILTFNGTGYDKFKLINNKAKTYDPVNQNMLDNLTDLFTLVGQAQSTDLKMDYAWIMTVKRIEDKNTLQVAFNMLGTAQIKIRNKNFKGTWSAWTQV